eukprot:SM000228S07374  [mRNA]  locus=s228:34353:38324:- [translate_table: standard]
MKYGLLIRSGFWFSTHPLQDWPLLACGITLAAFPAMALLTEKWRVCGWLSDRAVTAIHTLTLTAALLYPSYFTFVVQSGQLAGFILIFCSVTLWMKLVSYAHTNADARALAAQGQQVGPRTSASATDAARGIRLPPPECPLSWQPEASVDAPLVRYPENITVRNMLYFLAAPTLCYQLGYPRSPYVRKGWVLRQLAKLVVFGGLMLFIIEQYINPTVANSTHPLKGHLLISIERVLKLSIPTLYVWLCMFYCFFHLWLNILAELLLFGDREFYKDWWNAKTIEEPVHKWLVRHTYFPCLRIGIPKPLAMLIVFLLSAIFHEVVVGIPCHMVRFWAFLGIAFQVPLIVLTNSLYEHFGTPMVGNMLFWFFFCIVGQPMCLLLYYHDVVQASSHQV